MLFGGNVSLALIPVLTANDSSALVTVSSYNSFSASYAAWKAFDNSAATFWSGVSGTANSNKWLKAVFAVAKTVNKIDTTNIAANGYGYNAAQLQYSDDDSTWTTAVEMTGGNHTNLISHNNTHLDPHVYWRFLYVTNLAAGTQEGQMQQLQLWGY